MENLNPNNQPTNTASTSSPKVTTTSASPSSTQAHLMGRRLFLTSVVASLSPDVLAVNKIENLGRALTDLNVGAGSIHEVIIDRNGKAVIDGKSLAQKSENTPRPVASLTKRHSIKAEDFNRKSKVRSIIVGERFSIEELIILSLVSSSNEAAEALARILGRRLPGAGDARSKFINEMNRLAKTEIGMSRSHFDSPSGLSAGNISTVNDISRLTLAAYNYDPKHKLGEYSVNELGSEVGERNKERHNANRGLLNIVVNGASYVPLIQKTGFIKESGKCITILVANARKGGRMYLITLLDSTPGVDSTQAADELRRRKVLSILEKLKTI